MNIEQFRKAGYQAIDRICDYYYSLEERSVVFQVQPGYLIRSLPSCVPEEGEDFQMIADDYQKLIIPGLVHWQHPSFFAYFPAGCTFEGILADLYSSSVCNPGFNWSASPACTELEVVVMDWAAQLFGLSSAFLHSSGVGGGVIQTSASDSCLVAVTAARSRYQTEHPNCKMEDLVIYTTTQTHSIGLKAGLILGLEVRALEVRSEDRFSLRGETLRTALVIDEKLGRKPFILIANIGTTSSGAVDNFAEIRDVLKDYPSLWLHIDAAWAGCALSCPEYREMYYLNEVNEVATSLCTNFHKWGLTNFDISALWVKNRKLLTTALDVTPPYLRTKYSSTGPGAVVEFKNWQLGLGRRFRSLKLWFVLRSFGAEGFRKHIRESVGLNERFAELVRHSDILELVTDPCLALSVFRLNPANNLGATFSLAELNKLNRIFYDRISARRDILLTHTVLNGIACIRFTVSAYRTRERHVEKAFKLLQDEGHIAINAWKERQLHM
ncbi:hypothetical protein APHAL10511_004005 [Amanita phalloides]|nr:hypothetical protein APHAL10511_004005 [Amanita phalloides]